MLAVNLHQAKSTLSHLIAQVEQKGEVVTLCRNGHPVAKIIPFNRAHNPLKLHPELQGVQIHYDPTEPLSQDEWQTED